MSRASSRYFRLLSVRLCSVAVLVGFAGVAVATLPALASTPGHGGGSHRNAVPVGYDVSYPQCGRKPVSGQAFGIVGINGGLANARNPCLQLELASAVHSSRGGTSQPQAALYLNTGDPGNVYNGRPIPDWPKSGPTPNGRCRTTTAVGRMVGRNSRACAWEYGYRRAVQDVAWLRTYAGQPAPARADPWWLDLAQESASVAGVALTASSYRWWLDVETGNLWQASTALNRADLQGMVRALDKAGAASLGAYSTAYQWDLITGGTRTAAAGSLSRLSDWIPGAISLAGARRNCRQPPFTGHQVAITQWKSGAHDRDYAC